ncbi:MAG TPA: hypothetical protein VIY96_00430 [Thermoanaerobaculia bacterium]
MNDRRSLTAGVVLLLLGAFFLLSRTFHFSGPGVILILIGTIFLALSAVRGMRGPLLPGGVLLGLGAGFLLRTPLERLLPHWATIVLGLGAGFLFVALLDRVAGGGGRRPSPLVPGMILVAVALFGALAQRTPILQVLGRVENLWPWALVAAGVLLVGQALVRRRRA